MEEIYFAYFPADVKSAAAKAVKEDRKVQKEDKKTASKEKEKGKATKEVDT